MGRTFLLVPLFFSINLDIIALFSRSENMPYTLLFSRAIQDESVLRVLDVPIADRSVMIEVLSLLSPFRRLAGYAYALRSDGITDYERSSGVTLPFGKNRVNFTAATVPYFLEFFPRWGVRSGIISVYTGEPAPLSPAGIWKQALVGPYQMRLNAQPPGASYRTSSADEAIDTDLNGAIEAYMSFDYVLWKLASGAIFYKQIGSPPGTANPAQQPGYEDKKSEGGYAPL